MQNHHISRGRTHQKDATSFRFLDIGHAPFFFSRAWGKFEISENSDNASHAGYETKAHDVQNQKHLQCT